MSSIAYMNIAIIKYWGKDKFNPYLIPLVPSISLLSKTMYTKTSIEESLIDEFYLNNELQDTEETKKIFNFVDKVVKNRKNKIKIESYNTMPTAAGLASSSSGYAALTKELNKYFSLNLSIGEMSKISSVGSGSSARSFYNIAAFDEKGNIYELESKLDFCMSAIIISKNRKSISSRLAMQISKQTSTILDLWIKKNKEYFSEMKIALKENDFNKIGDLMQKSTMLMHETMNKSNPSINYLTKESLECIEYIKELNRKGIRIFFTTDAGPNVKVLYLKEDKKIIKDLLEEKYKGAIVDVI